MPRTDGCRFAVPRTLYAHDRIYARAVLALNTTFWVRSLLLARWNRAALYQRVAVPHIALTSTVESRRTCWRYRRLPDYRASASYLALASLRHRHTQMTWTNSTTPALHTAPARVPLQTCARAGPPPVATAYDLNVAFVASRFTSAYP